MKIGWIGTGVMGSSMCMHLMKAGHSISVFNRTASKTDLLVKQGAKFCDPKTIAKESDAVILMLGFPHDVRDVVLGNNGILAEMKPNSYLIDHTTSSPQLAKEIHDYAKEKNIFSYDAPVSGGDTGAKAGKLVTMVGGLASHYSFVESLFNVYSIQVKLMGGPGCGQHTKMANQIAIANNMIGVVECLLYGYKAGLDLPELIDLIKNGAAGSFSLQNLGVRMLKRDFAPGFYVEHFLKDIRLALNEANRMGLSLPGLSTASVFYNSLIQNGGAKDGTQALLKTLEQLNNIELPKYD